MIINGIETSDMELWPIVTTQDVTKKLIEDLRMSVEESLMVAINDVDFSSARNTCTSGEVQMRHNYVLNVCGMTINLINQSPNTLNGLSTK